MNVPSRVGIFAIAGILACGGLPAAHATVEPTGPQGGLTPGLPAGAEKDTAGSSLTMPCDVKVVRNTTSISFPVEIPFDALTVAVNGQGVQPQQTLDSSVVIDQPSSAATIHVELWDDESLTGECATSTPSMSEEPTPPEPEDPTETAEPTEPPGPSSPPKESETPSPTPHPSPSSSSSAPSTPSPSSTSSSRSPSSPSSETTGSPSHDPAYVFPEPGRIYQPPYAPGSQQPEASGPRIIRQFSHDQRYLLPQLLGINSQSGSGLIMPRPRNSEQGPLDFETLPPVSEDELEALKARLAAPDRADQPASQDLAAADIDERLADRTSDWLLPILIGTAGLGIAAYLLIKRRQREH